MPDHGMERYRSGKPAISSELAFALMGIVSLVWALGGLYAALVALGLLALFAFARIAGRTPWQWLQLWWDNRRRRWNIEPAEQVVNDRRFGGVRYQDGVAIAAVRVLGKYLPPTYLTGAATSETGNVLKTSDVMALFEQPLDITINSISVITTGARIRANGDYARVYDTFIGTPPYAGQREMWLILRVNTDKRNVQGLTLRSTVNVAALACAQRVVNVLRTKGIRAEVATGTDMGDLDDKLGGANALEPQNRQWAAVRGDSGWLTSFYYPPEHITDENLDVAWSRRYDSVTQNLTIYPDGRCTATLTVQSPQVVTLPPSVVLENLPGEQAHAVAANRALPGELVGGARAIAQGPPDLSLPIRESGVYLGLLSDGRRLVVPFTDPDAALQIHVEAEEALYKRFILRAAASGERVTVHTRDPEHWRAMSMPGIIITDDVRPAAGTTISVTDPSLKVSPPPATVMTLAGDGVGAHLVLNQVGITEVLITVPDPAYDPATDDRPEEERRPPPPLNEWRVPIQLFEAENLYMSDVVARRNAMLEEASQYSEAHDAAAGYAGNDALGVARTQVMPQLGRSATDTQVLPVFDPAATQVLPQFDPAETQVLPQVDSTGAPVVRPDSGNRFRDAVREKEFQPSQSISDLEAPPEVSPVRAPHEHSVWRRKARHRRADAHDDEGDSAGSNT